MRIDPKPLLIAALSLPLLAGVAKSEEVIALCHTPEGAHRALQGAPVGLLDTFGYGDCIPADKITIQGLKEIGANVEYWGSIIWNGRLAFRNATVSSDNDQVYVVTVAEERRL